MISGTRLSRGSAAIGTLVLLVALTGCARPGSGYSMTAKTTVGSSAATTPATIEPNASNSDDLGNVTSDLDEADGSLSQSGADTSTGDTAAAQGNQP